MPQWCTKHKQHTIDERCWECDREIERPAVIEKAARELRVRMESVAQDWHYLKEHKGDWANCERNECRVDREAIAALDTALAGGEK